jgi:hypothetical protein
MGTGKGVVVLVAAANRRIQAFGQGLRGRDRIADDDAGAVENDWELGLGEQPGGLAHRLFTAGRALESHDLWQLHIYDLGPEVARHIDLRRCRAAPGLLDHPVQDLRDPLGVPNLLLIADHVAEHRHLLDFLEAALADGPVRRLRGHQQHRGVVPVGGLDRGHKSGDARPVLRDRHSHLAGRPGVAVANQAGIGLVGAIPERDPGDREQIRDRHHRRADNPERMFDAVHLQDLHKGLFGRHFHCRLSLFLGVQAEVVCVSARLRSEAPSRSGPPARWNCLRRSQAGLNSRRQGVHRSRARANARRPQPSDQAPSCKCRSGDGRRSQSGRPMAEGGHRFSPSDRVGPSGRSCQEG